MRIAQVSPLYERVPPRLYGGTERVVSYLTEELVALGHDVTLFASGDSRTRARLVPGCERALRLDASGRDALALHVGMLDHVYRDAERFDVIHCHTDYLGLPLTRHVATPTLITLHGRLDLPDVTAMYRTFPHVPLVSISDAQRRPMPDAAWVRTVPHGVPGTLYRPSYAPGSYLLFVGRLAEEKRPDSAIAIARAAGMPLKIAAKVDPADRAYFARVVEPLLDDPLVEYLGEVDDAEKGELLRGATALLFPIDWPEPFGLIMIEALACGTPIVARRRGSVAEIVEDGVTGFVCETDAEMVRAVGDAAALDRRMCRAKFDRRFTVGTMAHRYVALYERLLGRQRPDGVPTAPPCLESTVTGNGHPV